MLRKRSRPTSKQVLMADYGALPSPIDKNRKPTSSIFGSPRLFSGFGSKGFTDTTESIPSPTSILDSKPFTALRNPFWLETHPPKAAKSDIRSHWENLDSGRVGLGIVDALADDKSDPKLSKPGSRKVLFGSQLKIQIPPLPPSVHSPTDYPGSPADFGVKTRSPPFSPGLSEKKSPLGSANSSPNSPVVFAGSLSASEMELSEDYTCVISYGPNPRTTHIFDNCIVESCCGVVGFSAARKENGCCADRSTGYPSESFLSVCYACKKNLGQGKDVYMYRGEKAFCSSECRHKEMMLEEEIEKLEPDDDAYGACL